MNNLEIKALEKRLSDLTSFVKDRGSTYSESEIIDWIADCINVFYEIGVDSIIIRNFLDHFRSRVETIESEDFFGKTTQHDVNAIGPFREEVSAGFSTYRTGRYVLAGSFYYAKVPFSAAKNTLAKKIDEKRIVSIWLIDEMQKYDHLRHIVSSLELIESKYEQRDADGLITESTTLLNSILNLDADLSEKSGLGGKLNALIDSQSKRDAFGVSQDLLRGLNSGRLVRNGKVVHKELSLKYDLPFLVAVSYAYLVIFFVECAILAGKVLTVEGK